MIFKSSFPNSPDVTILISGVAVDYTSIQSVTLDITENQHDMATITFTGLIPTAITDYTGAPVYISISLSPTQISSFNGYVTYIEPVMESRKGLINNSPVQTATAVVLVLVMTCLKLQIKFGQTPQCLIWLKH